MIAKTHRPITSPRLHSPAASYRETGFPSPATDHLEERLDLHKHIVQRPTSTFFSRVKGDSDQLLGVSDGDLLVIDRSLAYKHGTLVVAIIEGEFMICKLLNRSGKWALQLGDQSYVPLNTSPMADDILWGVVSHVVHSCY